MIKYAIYSEQHNIYLGPIVTYLYDSEEEAEAEIKWLKNPVKDWKVVCMGEFNR